MEWIQCSNRLPNTDEPLLVTVEQKPSGEDVRYDVCIGCFQNGEWLSIDYDGTHMFNDMGVEYASVIAWMTLPVPYRPTKNKFVLNNCKE